MGITCPCCGLRFIVCDAHLTPDGRTVQCFKCDTRWPMSADISDASRATAPLPPAGAAASPSGR